MTTLSADGRALIDVERGTDELIWRRSGVLNGLEPFEPGAIERAVIVAPHPDDEVLAVGATIARLCALGSRIVLVAVTDGEASHPGSAVITPDELRSVRPAESASACARLGITPSGVVRLGLPDGGVTERTDELARELIALLDKDCVCFAPFRRDGHPDHEASSLAARAAAAQAGAPLVEFPIWAWHASEPGDGLIPIERARAIYLTRGEQRAKSRAISAFCSQVEQLGPAPEDGPVLPPRVLAHFARAFEVVLLP
jgi:LmbE family N-acetylglucosaminyl deacetylase